MHSAPAPALNAPARRLALMDVPQPVADRRVHFVMIAAATPTDLVGPARHQGPHHARARARRATRRSRQRPDVLRRASSAAGRRPRCNVDRSTRHRAGHAARAGDRPSPHRAGHTGAGPDRVSGRDRARRRRNRGLRRPDPVRLRSRIRAYFVYTRGRTVPKSGTTRVAQVHGSHSAGPTRGRKSPSQVLRSERTTADFEGDPTSINQIPQRTRRSPRSRSAQSARQHAAGALFPQGSPQLSHIGPAARSRMAHTNISGPTGR